ncbi:Transcriptional regulator, AraC family [Acidisarcina polymorpha]|uniref:Transcriptional regulator, AraC family n=1 Tax=Acidisarcina polymorpha TaxID=2211140 RepID=A0A2Z5G5Q3_9BACT|nr:Transcriptional regulator, AraC family [Acidisarcina polymorpha]
MNTPELTAEENDFLVSTSQVNAEGVHVWQFDPTCPVDVVRHKLSGRYPFRMNRHEYYEIVFLRSGSVMWQVQDSMVGENEGDLFIMTNPKYHRVTEHSSSEIQAESLFFHPELVKSAWGSDFRALEDFFSRDRSLPHVFPAECGLPQEIHHLIQQISTKLPATDLRARLTVRAYLKMILVLLMTHAGMPERSSVTGSDRRRVAFDSFKPLFQLLEKRYSEPVSPNDAARVMHMSPSNFRRTFKQVTGQSFVSYLNNFRVAKAQELLASSDMPISEVGLETGFCDQSYFGMIFRRLTQATPRQYRRQIQQVRRHKDYDRATSSYFYNA